MSDDIQKLIDEAPAQADVAGEAKDQDASSAEVDSEQTPAAEEAPAAEETSAEQAEAVEEQPEAEESELEEEGGDQVAETESAVTAEGDESEVEASAPAANGSEDMQWYILKVQSNRERSIADALRRKVAIEGLDKFFGDVVVPMEKVTEFKGGKKKVVERKLYPGYIVVNMHINDDTWFAVRETSGIGDFTGSGGKPTPMLPHEVARIIQTEEEETDEAPKLNIAFELGDRVKVKEGNFESFEGEVNAIDEHSGRITVMINIFGRSTPVELEYWQVDQV